ncbi:ATP-binding protein [Gillisia sp. M10.2A]|uniref:histidine kinase n=1 Tax=Gillisia lutea TaxID=2909668 RepID=A0ABS9EBI0_9FLAO|nr:hybrid sensor histidine kinase/response regulator transcription factor [Gillisia lutea]MCF4100241.1 ATP-binding protein [Gillisia lutea]
MRFVILLIFLFCLKTHAQTHLDNSPITYPFVHIGVENGISPGSVNCFFKEDKGFLWIGTSSGLNRYDGYTVTSFNPNPSNSNAIQSRNYKSIFQDPLGNIWVGTVAGINIFDPIGETFTSHQTSILKKLNLPNISVENIIKDNRGNYWFLHVDSSISKYVAENKKIIRADSLDENIRKKKAKISAAFSTTQGNFWLIYEDGFIQKLDGSSFKIIDEIDDLKKKFSGSIHDFRIIADCKGNLWIHLFEDYGIYFYDTQKKQLKNYTTSTSEIMLKSNLVSDLSINTTGEIWVGTDHGGITVIDPSNFSQYYLESNEEIPNSLSNNSITSIYTDNEGIVWVGTFKNGVDYYHPDIIRFNLQQKLLSDPESLPFSDVNVFIEDKEGNLYIGTNGGGLIVRDNKTGRYSQYTHDPANPNSISSNIIVSLLYDSKENLWIGTYLGGLNKMTENGFQTYRNDPNDPNSILEDNIWELYEDSRGIIWLGTLTNGLGVISNDKKSFYQKPLGSIYFPNNNKYVSSITEDNNGNLWVGGDNGVDVFHPFSKYEDHFSSQPGDPTSLSNNNILSIHKDSYGKIWIGTQEGLDLYNPMENNFFHYDETHGLPGNKIIGIVEDDKRNLWLTTPYGIVQFEKSENGSMSGKIPANFISYSKIDGLQGNLFNENSIFKNSKGEILVGGLHGYNIFNPENFEYNKTKPKVVFTGFRLFNKEILLNEKRKGRILLEKPIHKTSQITLHHNENIFSIEFAALDFFQPSKNKYKYKLAGFEEKWQEVGSQQRSVTYTNLDPGEYEFKVLASNNDHVWSENPEILKIIIKPPFYKTSYAYALYLFLIIALLYFARRTIILNQRKRFVVEQEKRESAHLHKMDLMKIRFFSNISHEFKRPLSLILSPAEKLKKKHLGKEVNEQVDIIFTNAQRLLNLINQILDMGNIKNDKLLHSSKGNVIQFIKEIVEGFKNYADNEDVELMFESETQKFLTAFDRDKLDKIIYNLLSNAIKFTPAGGRVLFKITIKPHSSIKETSKLLQIEVKDTGIGISKDDQEHIFDRFFKVDHPEKNNPGSGIGLYIVQEYIKLYGGEISVKSNEGEGACFILKIPMQRVDDLETNIVEPIAKTDTERPNLLIIDDSKEFLNLLTRDFSQYYNVFIASDGETGWKKALSVRPDLIISGQMMQDMVGTELCSKIRNDSRTKHIPFILLSTDAGEREMETAFEIGVSDYIKKPANFNTLHSRVQNLINQRKFFQQVYSKKIEVPQFISNVEIEGEDEKLMKKLLLLIKENIGNSNFSVERLSSDLSVSRSYLYGKCMSLFEKSPQELIIESRLEKGIELLQKSQLTISEIAFQTGFNNPKNFTRNFKKKYRQLPSTYRQEFTSVS